MFGLCNSVDTPKQRESNVCEEREVCCGVVEDLLYAKYCDYKYWLKVCMYNHLDKFTRANQINLAPRTVQGTKKIHLFIINSEDRLLKFMHRTV